MKDVLSLIFTYAREQGIDPRLDMNQRLYLPRRVLDWFTGKPILDGKSRRNRLDPVAYLALDLGLVAAATAAAAYVATTLPIWASALALPPLWAIQTGRLRKMQTLEGHEAAHGNFFMSGDPRRNSKRRILGLTPTEFLGELATAAALSFNVADYKASHDLHHAVESFTSLQDPDVTVVRRLHRYGWSLVNPAAYVADFGRRLQSSLVTAAPVRRAMTVAVMGLLGGSAAIMPAYAWITAVLLPWVVLFRLSGALQVISLHDWRMTPVVSLQDYADRTWARFSGVALPVRGLHGPAWVKAWTLWWAEVTLLELPFRVGVLSPDLQGHDGHHLEWILVHDLKALHVFEDDWRNQPFRRAEMIRGSGDPLGMAMRELWGVRAFMRQARKNLARLAG